MTPVSQCPPVQIVFTSQVQCTELRGVWRVVSIQWIVFSPAQPSCALVCRAHPILTNDPRVLPNFKTKPPPLSFSVIGVNQISLAIFTYYFLLLMNSDSPSFCDPLGQ